MVLNLSLLLSGLQSSLASLGKSSRRVATVPLRPKGRDFMDDECGKSSRRYVRGK